jgi:hypothetical protein
VKTIFATTLIGTWEIYAEMLATMLLIFFTLINILASQTVGHEMVSREAGAHDVTRYTFAQLGATPVVNMT